MKRFLFVFILLISFNLTAFAKDEEIVFDEAKRTVKLLNEIRKELSLSEFSFAKPLKDMATSHSKYMSHNKTLSSVEDRTKEQYKGRYPWDRASYFDYDSKYVYEFIVGDINNFNEGISQIIIDPVTRNILLSPLYNEIGMSIEDTYGTFIIGGNGKNKREGFISYPYNKQENVKSQNDISILKNYLKKQNRIVESKIGMPITITYYDGKIKSMSDIKIDFKNKKTGEKVDYMVIKPGDYYFLDNSLVIIPLEKYDYDSKYELNVKFDVEFKNNKKKIYDKKINFSTDSFVAEKTSKKYITRGDFVEKLVISEKYKLIEPLEYKFSDVKVNDKLSKYIYTAASKNLISGFDNGRFETSLNITKEQVYVIMIKAYDLKHSSKVYADEKHLKKYEDYEDISSWARSSLAKAEKLGIVIKEDNKLNPKAYITEEEYDEILENFSKID